MNFKRLQKIIDKGIVVLSDHDDKKHEERYINLQKVIEEAQEYVEKNVYSSDINKEFYDEIKRCIKEFEKDRIVFILFLIILCGLLFVGVFYISYSHFHDHWYHGGSFKPPHTSKKTTKPRPTDDHDKTHTTKTTKTSKTTRITTSKVVDSTTSVVTDNTTETTTQVVTTKPSEVPEDPEDYGFVTVIFDNSSLVDLDNLYPMLDVDGVKTQPTTWKLYSTLSKGSRDYVVRYTINFIDNVEGLVFSELLDIKNLKFQLIAKNNGIEQYNSGPQYYDDYPEVEYEAGKFYRPIITIDTLGNTFKNNETLDFELRMWIEETGQNQNMQQGKKYKFNIFVEAEYKFIR